MEIPEITRFARLLLGAQKKNKTQQTAGEIPFPKMAPQACLILQFNYLLNATVRLKGVYRCGSTSILLSVQHVFLCKSKMKNAVEYYVY